MAAVDLSTVASLLEGLGVSSIPSATGSRLLSLSAPKRFIRRVIRVEVRTSLHWITLSSYLYGNVPPGNIDAVSRLLARLNLRSRIVRYGMLSNFVVAQMEIPRPRLSRETLSEGLTAVVVATTANTHEIAAIASSSHVASLFMAVCEAETGTEGLPPSAEFQAQLDELDLHPNPIERFSMNLGGTDE